MTDEQVEAVAKALAEHEGDPWGPEYGASWRYWHKIARIAIAATDDEIFRKHYEMQRTALNEIKEIIALHDYRGHTIEEVLQDIEDVAAYASQVDLTNPIRLDESRALIERLPYKEGILRILRGGL